MESAGSARKYAAARMMRLQKRSIERPWEKVFEPEGLGFALQVRQNQLHVTAEFPKDLAAGAAGRGQDVGVGRHSHAAEPARAFGNSLENRHALGANGQAIGG